MEPTRIEYVVRATCSRLSQSYDITIDLDFIYILTLQYLFCQQFNVVLLMSPERPCQEEEYLFSLEKKKDIRASQERELTVKYDNNFL